MKDKLLKIINHYGINSQLKKFNEESYELINDNLLIVELLNQLSNSCRLSLDESILLTEIFSLNI